jgi:hypothetical protein
LFVFFFPAKCYFKLFTIYFKSFSPGDLAPPVPQNFPLAAYQQQQQPPPPFEIFQFYHPPQQQEWAAGTRMGEHGATNSTQSIADYLAQLLKDRKQVTAFPNVFIHVERLIDEGMSL